MREYYTTKEASELTGASKQIIRTYTDRYARYLSTEATPDPGKTRRFTAADLKLLAYIYQQTGNGSLTHEQVLANLIDGALDEFEWDPPPPSAPDGAEGEPSVTTALVPAERLQAAQALLLDAQRREQEIAKREQALQQRVSELERDLGKAQGALETYQALRRRPQWWRWLFGGE